MIAAAGTSRLWISARVISRNSVSARRNQLHVHVHIFFSNLRDSTVIFQSLRSINRYFRRDLYLHVTDHAATLLCGSSNFARFIYFFFRGTISTSFDDVTFRNYDVCSAAEISRRRDYEKGRKIIIRIRNPWPSTAGGYVAVRYSITDERIRREVALCTLRGSAVLFSNG